MSPPVTHLDAVPAPLLPAAPWFQLPEGWEQEHPVLSPNAKPETHWAALAVREIEGHEGDGGGRIFLDSVASVPPTHPAYLWQQATSKGKPPELTRSAFYRFTLGFEVGPHGIAAGGMIFLVPETFWFWSPPQTIDPSRLGFTTATTGAASVQLEPTGDPGTFRVAGRDLQPGDRIEFIYGAGPKGAQIERYAEREAEIMLGVDADGDGFRRWLPQGVFLNVSAAAGKRLLVYGPADIPPGLPFEVQLAIVDRVGNRARWPTNDSLATPTFQIRSLDNATLGLASPDGPIAMPGPAAESRVLTLTPEPGEGTIRLRVEGLEELAGASFDLPPIVVRQSATRLYWGDLHGHSRLSDGTGTPEDYFRYAREVARLDVIALTDHDHWGPRPLDEEPEVAGAMLRTTHKWNDPGRFITLPGYEWTSWLHGHRHVLYFGREAPIYSSIDEATDRPDKLWNALRGHPALTFAHHSAGEPIATNWFYPPDPELEPVTEIVSVHGMSESADAPSPVRGAIPGNFVRDVLRRGSRLGFIGSGDTHDGHPGLAQISSGQGGLAGILSSGLDRRNLLSALRARQTFATNGIRPFMEVSIENVPMGGSLEVATPADGDTAGAEQILRVLYEATAPIKQVDLIRTGRVATLPPEDLMSLRLHRRIPRLEPGEFHFVRIQQEDGGVAWSSPIFVGADPNPAPPGR